MVAFQENLTFLNPDALEVHCFGDMKNLRYLIRYLTLGGQKKYYCLLKSNFVFDFLSHFLLLKAEVCFQYFWDVVESLGHDLEDG